jgi:FlaA1/EpsC-like NDP-sugar epimerase
MSVEEAVDLVFVANGRMTGGEVFVFKMPTFDVGTLAETMIGAYAPACGHSPEDVDIKIIGARPGERMHEKLISRDEIQNTIEQTDMFVILPELDLDDCQQEGEQVSFDDEYTSANEDLMSSNELLDMINQANILPVEATR